MKYMLMLYAQEETLDDATRQRCYAESAKFAHELKAAGQYIAASPLQPTAMATSVRLQDGKPLITDGPFAETREQFGGYFLVDAQNLDEAIAISTRIPAAKFGTVEIRPLIEVPDLPAV